MNTNALLARTAPSNSAAFEAGSSIGSFLGYLLVALALIYGFAIMAKWPGDAKPSSIILAIPLIILPLVPIVIGKILPPVKNAGDDNGQIMLSVTMACWGLWLVAFLFTAITIGKKRKESGIHGSAIEQHPALARRNMSSRNKGPRPRPKSPPAMSKPSAGIVPQTPTGGILPQAPISEDDSST